MLVDFLKNKCTYLEREVVIATIILNIINMFVFQFS